MVILKKIRSAVTLKEGGYKRGDLKEEGCKQSYQGEVWRLESKNVANISGSMVISKKKVINVNTRTECGNFKGEGYEHQGMVWRLQRRRL